MRHGQATRITVLLMYNPSQLVVTIKDNGTGAVDLAPKGGLKSLQERLRGEGGSVTLGGVKSRCDRANDLTEYRKTIETRRTMTNPIKLIIADDEMLIVRV